MPNARKELQEVLRRADISTSEILVADLWREVEDNDPESEDLYKKEEICLPLGYDALREEQFWNALDFEYDQGFGAQHLHGTVWLTNHRWLTRGEYDGSEWWDLHVYPEFPK
jgi:hypothetical protein